MIAGTSALAAPMSCAGTVLSQPPIKRTASIGWARIISSVSIAIRLRRNMLVGLAKDSWMETGRKFHRQPAGQQHAAFHRLDQARDVAVAWVEIGKRVGDPDDRPLERVVGKAGRLDEGLAQKERKARIAIAGQAFAQSLAQGGLFR
jgi:hypothetical protein